jgi:hypothetical protein
VLDLLDQELAAAGMEIDARLAEDVWPSVGTPVQPIHLSNALNELVRQGRIIRTTKSTRGGRQVDIYQAVGGRRTTAITRAAARKRLLLARYLGWSQGSPARPGLIGPAGERAVHEALVHSATYRLARPEGGNVGEFLGQPMHGRLDAAAILTPITNGLPGQAIAVPIEVKNQRDWIHPTSRELYQLLDKAATLQAAQPAQPILPVLVTRRAARMAFMMAKQMGFFIVESRRQYISRVDDNALNEVRTELGFRDLMVQQGVDQKLVRLFGQVLPDGAADRADRWALTASDKAIRGTFLELRLDSSLRRRARMVRDLRQLADRAGVNEGGW